MFIWERVRRCSCEFVAVPKESRWRSCFSVANGARWFPRGPRKECGPKICKSVRVIRRLLLVRPDITITRPEKPKPVCANDTPSWTMPATPSLAPVSFIRRTRPLPDDLLTVLSGDTGSLLTGHFVPTDFSGSIFWYHALAFISFYDKVAGQRTLQLSKTATRSDWSSQRLFVPFCSLFFDWHLKWSQFRIRTQKVQGYKKKQSATRF